jgi:hypothetical protein
MYFYDGSGTIQAQAQDSVLGLALSGNWTGAEYNIFGEGGAGLYTFNPNVTLVGRINVSNGRRASPLCANKSYTGETNSLTAIGGGCCPVGGTASTLPAIVFEESNIAGIGAPFCLLTEWPSLPEL